MATKTKANKKAKTASKAKAKAKVKRTPKAPFKLCVGRTDRQGKYGFTKVEYNSLTEVLTEATKATKLGKDKGIHEVLIVLR